MVFHMQRFLHVSCFQLKKEGFSSYSHVENIWSLYTKDSKTR